MSTIYSFSQVQLYSQCPLAFRYKYIDWIKLEIPEESADLILWDIVHKTLEKLYEDINNFRNVELDALIDYYHSLWTEKRDSVYQSWNDIVVKWKWQIDDYIKRWQEYIKSYFEKHKPFDDIKVVSTEQNIYFNLDENIKFRWIIDRLDKSGYSFIINDYKTNKNLPTEKKQQYIEQLTLYWLGIKQQYGKYFDKIFGKIHFLHFDVLDTREITEDLLSNVVDKYKNIVQEIQEKRFAHNMWKLDVFEPIENVGCRFCEFKSICPLFSHASMDDEIVDKIWQKTIKGMIDEYAEISIQVKTLENSKKQLKEVISNYANKKWMKRLYWNKYQASISKGISYSIIDKENLQKLLEQKWLLEEALDISNSKIWNLVKNSKLSLDECKKYVKQSSYSKIITSPQK